MKRENDLDLDFLKLQYQVLSNKQISHNSSLWNAPSLLFIAQAFLWNIALDSQIHIVIRCLISLLSVLIAIASLQNFIRSRLMEIADSEQLLAIERLMMNRKDAVCPAMIVNHKFTERTIINTSGKRAGKLCEVVKQDSFYKKNLISHWRTFDIWKFLLKVILGVTIILSLYNLSLMIEILPMD